MAQRHLDIFLLCAPVASDRGGSEKGKQGGGEWRLDVSVRLVKIDKQITLNRHLKHFRTRERFRHGQNWHTKQYLTNLFIRPQWAHA